MTALPPGYTLREGADPVAAHRYLAASYWAKDISLEKVRRAFSASLAVSIWHLDEQVGAARVLTDYVSLAYLNDVYVLDNHGGKGLATAMVEHLRAHPDLQDVGRWALYTKDAQRFYSQLGWREYPWPERMMIIDSSVFPE